MANRKLIFQVMVSLDGYFEGPNGELDWHNVDNEFNDYAVELLNQVDTLVFGKKTYETMADYWPTAQALENDPIVAEKMNALKKIIASTTLHKVTWNNSVLVKEDIVNKLREEKNKTGKHLAVFGSSNLMLTLMENELVDEYRIMVNPVVLGKGHSLFNGSDKKGGLKLSQTYYFESGNIMLIYLPI